jgi:hypothetical protein
MSPDELRYLAGYDAGYSACINLGSSDAARLQLLDPHLEAAYRSGWEWACWDYDDANGGSGAGLRSLG